MRKEHGHKGSVIAQGCGQTLELGLGDDVKGHGFLMVYTWCAHVQRRLRV